MNLGCGNSSLSEDLYSLGFKTIKNIDFSPTAIQMMKERCKHLPELEWLCMDFTSMKEIANER